MGPSGRFYSFICLMMLIGTGFISGRAPRTRETLPDFHESCRVTRHSLVFRGLMGSQRTPGFGASHTNTCDVDHKFNSF